MDEENKIIQIIKTIIMKDDEIKFENILNLTNKIINQMNDENIKSSLKKFYELFTKDIKEDEKVQFNTFFIWLNKDKLRNRSLTYYQISSFLNKMKMEITDITKFNIYKQYAVYDLYDFDLNKTIEQYKNEELDKSEELDKNDELYKVLKSVTSEKKHKLIKYIIILERMDLMKQKFY
jgi:hypothetical protein